MPDQAIAPPITTDADIPYLTPLRVPTQADADNLVAQMRHLEESALAAYAERDAATTRADLALGTAAREHAENLDFRHRIAALQRCLWWVTLTARHASGVDADTIELSRTAITAELDRIPWPATPAPTDKPRPRSHRARRRFPRAKAADSAGHPSDTAVGGPR
jgi:hypothetical protein